MEYLTHTLAFVAGAAFLAGGLWWAICAGTGAAEQSEREDYPAFSDSDSRTVPGINGERLRRPR